MPSEVKERCFACGRALGKSPKKADTRDAQIVYVGRDCYGLIVAAGERGYQPSRGGPRLYPIAKSAPAVPPETP